MEMEQSRTLAVTRWRLTASGAMRVRGAAPCMPAAGSGRALDLAVAARVLELAAIALVLAGLVVAWL